MKYDFVYYGRGYKEEKVREKIKVKQIEGEGRTTGKKKVGAGKKKEQKRRVGKEEDRKKILRDEAKKKMLVKNQVMTSRG